MNNNSLYLLYFRSSSYDLSLFLLIFNKWIIFIPDVNAAIISHLHFTISLSKYSLKFGLQPEKTIQIIQKITQRYHTNAT